LVWNPFNGDTDGDGIPDGEQLDSDGDGIFDAFDSAPHDATATADITPIPRYALFLLPNAGDSPIQINNRGTVLYPQKFWKGGALNNLATAGSGVYRASARGMNDLDVILGYADHVSNQGGVTGMTHGRVCYWPAPDQAPQFVSLPASPGTRYAYDSHAYPWIPRGPGPILSDSGHFFAHALLVEDPEEPAVEEGPVKLWKLPVADSPGTSMEESATGLQYLRDTSLMWGRRYAEGGDSGLVHAPGERPLLPGVPLNVIPLPGGIHIATRSDPWTGSSARALKDGEWIETPSYSEAIDIGDDGVAIGRQHDGLRAPIWINGRWTPLERTAPHISAEWTESGFPFFKDMSPNGWILGERLTAGAPDHFVMLPIRAVGRYSDSTNNERLHSAGVDDVSIGSPTPDVRPDENMPPPVEERIWMMAPRNGRSGTVTLLAPLHSGTPLKISAPGVKFNGAEEIVLTESETTFSLTAPGAESGEDIPLQFRFGDQSSASQPLGVKVMKERTIRVTVHPVRSIVEGKAPNAPNVVPDEAVLQQRLNDIYHPQINAKFLVTVKDMVDLEWDNATAADMGGLGHPDDAETVKPGNGILDWRGGEDLRKEEQTIHGALGDTAANINIYVLGGGAIHGLIILDGRLRRLGITGAYAFAKRVPRVIFADGDVNIWDSIYRRNFAEDQYTIYAHEIGHILIEYGHPDEGTGAAPLPGLPEASYRDRLMVSGNKMRHGNPGILLVKGEWDAAERWMQEEERENRLGP
jgi:hypothetical protein